MRKITTNASKAFWDNGYFKQDNTTVDIMPMPHGVYKYTFKLHNTIIAERYNGVLTLNTDGYYTNTTKERLNGVLDRLGYKVYQKKGVWYVYNSQNEESIEFKDGMEFRL